MERGWEVINFEELEECTILSRLNRFTVLVEIGGLVKPAYLNNTGRLKDYIVNGKIGYCIKRKRGKLEYRIIGVESGEYAALVDTLYQENAFIIAQGLGLIPWLREPVLVKRNSRVYSEVIDFVFAHGGLEIAVELKSAVMNLGNGIAGYPDAPTIRGRRQILALANYAKSRGKSIVVLVSGIPATREVLICCEVDRELCSAVKLAVESGVLFKAINLYLDPRAAAIVLGNIDLPVKTP